MRARTAAEAQKAYEAVDDFKSFSDKLIPIPLFGGVGVDGLLALLNMTPVTAPIGAPLNAGYSALASVYALYQGWRGRASPWTMVRAIAYLGLDGVVSGVPWLGGFADFFFRGHAFAARAIQRDMEKTLYVEGRFRDARASGEHEAHRAEMRAQGKSRIVYLED
jgi:hypothetical protein